MGSGVVPPRTQDPQDPFEALRTNALQQSREAHVTDDQAFEGLRSAALNGAALQKYGLGWWALMGARAAKGVADTSIAAVDTASRGWMRIGQYLQHYVGGVPNSDLISDQGIAQRFTGKANADAYDVAQALGATDLGDLTPGEKQITNGQQFADALRNLDAARLGDQGSAAASIAGELLGFTTGPMGLFGKDAAAIGAAMSKPAANFFARKIAAGSMTKEAVAQLAREGKLLETMAKDGGWAGKAVAAAPGLVGEYGALMAQTYARAPNGEGAAAVEHALVPGIFFLGLGRGARYAANRALDASLSPAAKDGLLEVQRALANGTTGRWGQTWDALQSMPIADRLKVLGIGTTVAGAEALGFTLTDKDQVKDFIDGWAGDPTAMARFRARWLGTTAGVLTMKAGMPLEAVPYFKRLAPDLNSYRLEKLRQQAAADAKAGAEEAGKKALEPGAMLGEADLGRALGEPVPEAALTPEGEAAVGEMAGAHTIPPHPNEPPPPGKPIPTAEVQRELARQQIAVDRAVYAHVDPLMRSGWDLEERDLDQPQPEIRLTAPGGGHVVVRVPGAGSQPEVVVSPATWRAIRGSEEPPKEPASARPFMAGPQVAGGITLRGNHAQQFLTDLGLRTATQKMRATLRLGRLGFGETGATLQNDGGWRDPATGLDYTYGIDGSLQRRSPFDKTWERVPEDDPLQATLKLPVGEQVNVPTHWTGAMEKWAQFIFEKQRSFPEPEVDQALAMALNTAQYGRQTESAMELRDFFEHVDPMELASVFGPESSKAFAHTIAAVGAHLTNSNHAAAMVREQIPELAAGRRILWERRLAGDHGGGTLLEAPGKDRTPPPERQLNLRMDAEQALASPPEPDAPPEILNARALVDAWLKGGGKDSPPRKAIELLARHGEDVREREAATHVNLSDLYGPSEVGSGLVIRQAAQTVGKGISALAGVLRRGRGTAKGAAGAGYQSKAKPLDVAFEHKPFAVGKIGTPEALAAQQMAHAGIDFGATQRAELEQMGAEETLRRLGGHGGSQYRAATDWLSQEEEVKPGMFQTRFSILTDNGKTKAPVPPLAQELVDAHHALRIKTGEFAERTQTFRKNPNRGNKANEYEPFVTNKSRRISPHTDLQDEWFDLFDRPSSPRNEEALRKLAEANGMKPPEADAFVKRVQQQADERVANHETLDRSSAIEHARELQFVPDRMTLKDGTELQLRSGEPFEATKSMLESEIQANIGRAAFGQDLPEITRKQHPSYTKPGPEGAIRAVRRSVERAGGTKEQTEKAEKIMRAQVNQLEGRSPEGFNILPPKFARIAGGLEAVRRAGKMVGGSIQDLAENIGNPQPGVTRVLRGMFSAAIHPVQAIRSAYRSGAVTRDTIFDRETGLLKGGWRAITKVISAPKRFSQRFSNAWSARSMAYMVRDLKAQANMQGNGGLLHRIAREGDAIFIRGLGFTEAETQAMVGGRASDDLYMKLMQRGTRMITGELQPSERSELADSKKFNALVAFARWPLNQARKSFRVIGQTAEAYRNGSPAQKIAATQKLLTYYFGATAAGLIGTYFGMWLANPAHPKDTLEQFARELETEGWFSGILKRGLLQSVLGGPFALASGWMDRNRDITQNVANATVPGQIATEIGSALLGQGAYKDQDAGGRLQTFLRRSYTGSKYLAGVGAAVGLTEDNGLQIALRRMNQWAQDAGKPFDSSGITPIEDQAFATAMRSLSQAVRNNSTKTPEEIVATPEFQDAMHAALGVAKGVDIWRSLRSRQILDNRTPEDLASMTSEIGEDSMQTLYNHDSAMRTIAQAFRTEEGTPRHVLPELETRLATAAQQVQLGNPGTVWKPILEEVLDDTVAKIRAGQQDYSDLAKVADAMSIAPEKLTGILGEKEQRALQNASGPGAALMLRGFLMRMARERARNQIRKERKAAMPK